jgi:hypothetical protein
MTDKVVYKFCIISFVSGSRGAFLGHQLWLQHPELFSIRPGATNEPTYHGHYDTWHIYEPYFSDEIFVSHPNLKLENLFESSSAQFLDNTKYNIILTHCYTNEELAPLYEALAGHEIKTIQVTFNEDDKAKIIERILTIFPKQGIRINHKFTPHFQEYLDSVESTKINNAIPVEFALINDYSNIPNLDNITENFKL